MNHIPTLIYVHDPMCSWCYGFKSTLTKIVSKYQDLLDIKFFLGGLAVDTEELMPDSMRKNIQDNWHKIEQTIPDIKFNYNFWSQCIPRRSTYPSCRAVIAAKKQNYKAEIDMLNAIQSAYYLESKNPSDYPVLYELSKNIGINLQQFKDDIHSQDVNNELLNQIDFCRKIGADSFPSIYMFINNKYYPIVIDYNNADISIEHINSYI